MRESTYHRGATLLEVIVGMGILGLLSAMMFAVYVLGANAWMKGSTETDLLQASQLVTRFLAKEAEAATAQSLSFSSDNRGTAFLSASDSNGAFQYDSSSLLPLWQDYLLFWFEPANGTLFKRKVPVVGTPVETTPAPFSTFTSVPLDAYLVDGRPLVRGLTEVRFTNPGPSQLKIELDVEQRRYGNTEAEVTRVETLVHLRNTVY